MHDRHVVLDEQDGAPCRVQTAQQGDQTLLLGLVQTGAGLIQHEEARAGGVGAGHREQAALAGGQDRRLVVGAILQADQLQGLLRHERALAGALVGPGGEAQGAPEADAGRGAGEHVFGHAQLVEQVEALERPHQPGGGGARGVAHCMPSKAMRPPCNLTAPQSALVSVLLPAPFGPISAVSSPGCSVKLTSCSACSPPNRTVGALDDKAAHANRRARAQRRRRQGELNTPPGHRITQATSSTPNTGTSQ